MFKAPAHLIVKAQTNYPPTDDYLHCQTKAPAMRILLNTFLLLLPFTLLAQLNIPPSSAPAELRTQIGLTNFTITYHPVSRGELFSVSSSPMARYGAPALTKLPASNLIRISVLVVTHLPQAPTLFTLFHRKKTIGLLSSMQTLPSGGLVDTMKVRM